MNKKSLLLLILSAALLPLGAQAKPEGVPADGKGKKGPPSPEQIIERMDADKNGTISKEEAKGPLAKNFDKIDANSDGQLDKKELRTVQKKRQKQAKEAGKKLKEADTDGNGSISKDEASAAELKKLVEHFDKIDADSNGEISKEEMRAMRQKGKKRQGDQKAE